MIKPGWPYCAKFCHLGYFLKARCFGENMVCCRFIRVFKYKGFHVDILDFQIELRWHFLATVLATFSKIWVKFFPFFWSPWIKHSSLVQNYKWSKRVLYQWSEMVDLSSHFSFIRVQFHKTFFRHYQNKLEWFPC